MKQNLQLIKTENFLDNPCDFYDSKKEFWVTREQIGRALEYKTDPANSIAKIHQRHSERLDKFSVVVKLSTPYGIQETTLYSPKGIYEICRWSRQAKADMFYDWVYEMLEKLRTGRLDLEEQLQSAKEEFKELSEAIKLAHLEDGLHSYHFSNEYDLINRIVLGMSTKKYKKANNLPENVKSIRPYLSAEQVKAITKLEKFDTGLMLTVEKYDDRKQALTSYYAKINGFKQLQAN